MFWDKIAGVYDLFGNLYNGKANRKLCALISESIYKSDVVLECACGTGMISEAIAPVCKSLTATDFSEGMLKQAKKKCSAFTNVTFQKAYNWVSFKRENKDEKVRKTNKFSF